MDNINISSISPSLSPSLASSFSPSAVNTASGILSLEKEEALKRDVYGVTYKEAREQCVLLTQEIVQRTNMGFGSMQECAKWAHDHNLDHLLYSPSQHKFYNVSHKGEIMTEQVFEQYYGSILFYRTVDSNGTERRLPWSPNSFIYYDNACIPAEQSDGIHAPLYHRSYVEPTGYYNAERGTFNVAKPFPVFAQETGRDTSHIYALIEHIAGECAMWLLAWLRAKLLYPCIKTQVVPIIVSRTQGSGKTTFAEVICKGLFGKENVLVSDQYDSSARFNADYADALIVCLEEKEEQDRRNSAGTLKSRATSTTIRKEQKGIDPIYQESYTDFIMTTNKDVPVKFDGREDQRRFMVMEADDEFTRKTSKLADEVFTKLYGRDANYNKVGIPFVQDRELIAQFKHELYTREDIAAVELRKFPKTSAYKKCYTLPRTSEASEIESILRALAPFIRASLDRGSIVTELTADNKLSDIVNMPVAIFYLPAYSTYPATIALCRPLIFYDSDTRKPFQHSVVERGLYDSIPWLMEEYGLDLVPDMDPIPGGFPGVPGRYKMAPAARICLASALRRESDDDGEEGSKLYKNISGRMLVEQRLGKRFRVNNKFIRDEEGCFETVNELKEGVSNLKDKTENVQYMDTFLLESDDCSSMVRKIEEKKVADWLIANGQGVPIEAENLYAERLKVQKSEGIRLMEEGVVCRMVYSGAKSIHMLVRVHDAPTTLDEYHFLHAYLCSSLSDKLSFDPATNDPARLTRSPISIKRTTSNYGCCVTGTQCLMQENWKNVYDVRWRELYESWKKRPMSDFEKQHGSRLYPIKPIYHEALLALIDGSFWTNDKWNGQRQDMFFVAYRLYRLLGYTHEQLWKEDEGGVLYKLNEYYKQDEVQYWKSREKCRLVRDIDEDVDSCLEEQENMEDSTDE